MRVAVRIEVIILKHVNQKSLYSLLYRSFLLYGLLSQRKGKYGEYPPQFQTARETCTLP